MRGVGPKRAKERGIALLLVLWTLMLLSLLVVAFAQQTRLERQRVGNVINTAKAATHLQAGLSLAIAGLLDSKGNPGWVHDGTPHEVEFAGRRFVVSVQDANGCMDINKAEVGQLRALLRGIGVEQDRAGALAAAIIDWRDPDNVVTPNGAEAGAYAEAGVASGPGNRPFISVAELKGVLGMTPDTMEKLSPLVTVLATEAEINPMTAPEPLLRATLPEEQVPGILKRRAARAAAKGEPENAIDASAIGTTDLRSATDADLEEVPEGPVYVIGVAVEGPDGAATRARAVIWLTQQSNKPYQVLDWQLVQSSQSSNGTTP